MKWSCPECGSTNLRVVGRVALDSIQKDDGNFQTFTDSDCYWDDESYMWRCECGCAGPSKQFEVEGRSAPHPSRIALDEWIQATFGHREMVEDERLCVCSRC
jgi:hypothetical protein